jgi:hypothetical protein
MLQFGRAVRRRRLETRQVPLAAQHLAQRIRFALLTCGREAQVTEGGSTPRKKMRNCSRQ